MAKRKRSRKSKNEGGAIFGLADIEAVPRGNPPLSGTSGKDSTIFSKQNTQVIPVVKSEAPSVVGGAKAKRVTKYDILVKDITQKKNLKLPEALKYIQE